LCPVDAGKRTFVETNDTSERPQDAKDESSEGQLQPNVERCDSRAHDRRPMQRDNPTNNERRARSFGRDYLVFSFILIMSQCLG